MNYYFSHFDRLFDEFSRITPTLASNSVKLPSYPPCNCVVSSDREKFTLEFAMAGYSSDDIEVTAEEGSLNVRASKDKAYEGTVIHKGISSKNIDFTLSTDLKYDSKKAKTSFENGMLIIEVPIKKEAKAVKLM